MVHIKRVEIFGLKSFGFKNTTIDFRPGLTTISGPNGSGKSNILNAIIFAMGENRPSIMGVDRLRSLIHDVGGTHRGTKMTRSSIHFENMDRRIPVNTDTVEITREMDGNGESTYYVNKKKTQRTNVLNILDTANAALNQLNALQQGTVTKIAKSSAEEKRIAIEDLIGLSSFDEKKEAAKKQLTDADHRLEIALTRMNEVKKNIDDLEEARNIYLRHKALETEITRLNVIDAARNFKVVTGQIEAVSSESAGLAKKIRLGQAAKEELQAEIEKTDTERKEFLAKVSKHDSAKAKVESGVKESIRIKEEANAAIAVSKRRIEYIIKRVPEIEHELRVNSNDHKTLVDNSALLESRLEEITAQQAGIKEELKTNNEQLAGILGRQQEITTHRKSIDGQIKNANRQKQSVEHGVAGFNAEIYGIDKQFASNNSKRAAIKTSISNLETLSARLRRLISGHKKASMSHLARIRSLNSKKARIEGEIGELAEILEKSQNAISQFKAKLKVIRNIMHEDYSIAQLKEHAHKIGIVGFAYEMLSWDTKYERAVLAAGSEWLKAIVTKDIATMISLSEYAQTKGLPKLKIISLESPASPIEPGGGLDILSDHVSCRGGHKSLASFLFDNVVIAKSTQDAHRLSSRGYRAVTLDGNLVEPNSRATIVDINSKISKLTRIIANAATLDGLVQSISLLKEYQGKKQGYIKHLEAQVELSRQKLAKSSSNTATSENELERLLGTIANSQNKIKGFDERNARIAERKRYVVGQIEQLGSKIKAFEEQIASVEANIDNSDSDKIAGELERLGSSKIALEAKSGQALTDYNGVSSELAGARTEIERSAGDAKRLEEEKDGLLKERTGHDKTIEESQSKRDTQSRKLEEMRQKEQEIISAGGASVAGIAEYDERLDGLRGRERTVEREISAATRSNDSLRRDLADLTSRAAGYKRVCATHDVSCDIEGTDVKRLLTALRQEFDTIANLNTLAPSKYQEISTGYRSLSDKKNTLETERTKIVGFIEGVEKGKRQKFLEAFAVVDSEISELFTMMTGGNARLELQDEDNIFNAGISYMTQFPKKTKRESSATSGGEQSLAAVVFVLALQKLNPSPFYLFDEVDAHLDASNAEKLGKVLKERSADSQFILVSHKDTIIKKADLVYGVYPSSGASQVLTYKDKRVPKISN